MSSLPGAEALLPGLRPFSSGDHLWIQAANVSKSYALASGVSRRLVLFDRLTFSVPQGQILAIVGQSGAGKSTLLHLLGALDRPDAGEIRCGATKLGDLSLQAAAQFRNREVGYVWQFHYLLPEFTAAENTAMPLLARGMSQRSAREQAVSWLAKVGLADRVDHRSGELSGGEQQRIALARALITKPKLLLADEPTGDLDGETADAVFAMIEELHRSEGLTTVLVTHNMALARRCHRVLRLSKGGMTEVPASEL